METTEADFAGIEHFLNPRHERNADAVAQLNQVKAKFACNFAQHDVSGCVASGVPTGGKRNHLPNERSRYRREFRLGRR